MNDMPERPSRDNDRNDRPFRGGEGRSSRDGDRPQRSTGDRDSRPSRDGDRPQRSGESRGFGRPGGDRDGRPARDGDRPQRFGGDRDSRGGDRDSRGGDHRPAPGEDRGRGRGARQEGDRPIWQQLVARPKRDDAEKSPLIPEEIMPADLAMPVRAQLKTLTAENADMVARHLIMVQLLIDQDPELAHKHAKAAASRAGRIAVVRETIGITAYTVGDYPLALRELMTFRRISGSNDQLPIMVDCERGMGRPDRALELGRSVDRNGLEPSIRVNLAIAMSGARLDRGETELALAELQIAELNPQKVFDYSPVLFWAYADVLEDLKRADEAAKWATLGDRAAAALAAKSGKDEEVFEILEEFNIPTAEERPKREERGERGGYGDRDRGDRPSYGDRGDRPSYGDRGDRGSDRGGDRLRFGDRDSRPPRDGDRPRFGGGDRDRDSRPAPRRDDRGERPSYGDRPARDDRGSDRPSYGDRDRDSRPAPRRDDRGDGGKPAWKKPNDR